MTSKFSIDNRELLQRISSGEAVVGIDFGNLIVRELAVFRLAAMDSSESIELPLDYLKGHKDGLEWASQLAEANHPETGDWLYDDPIELAKAIRKGPDMPPAQPAPVVDADDNFYSWFGREWAENYQHNQYTTAAKQMLGVMAESAWKAGRRAAMLHAGNSPAQSDCCPAQNVVSPAQSPIDHGYQPECECSGCKATARICTEMAVNSLVIPNEMTSEQAYEIGYYYGDPVDVFARGANWMRQHIIDSTLAAAPQEVKGE
ncbi:Eaa1 [Klebsiella pneumoniae]|nr:Eaa1 [Klebsiella pneumoniae]